MKSALDEATASNTQLKDSLSSVLAAKESALAQLSELRSAVPIIATAPPAAAHKAPVVARRGTSPSPERENLIGVVRQNDPVRRNLGVMFSRDAAVKGNDVAAGAQLPVVVPAPVSQAAQAVPLSSAPGAAAKATNRFASLSIPVSHAPVHSSGAAANKRDAKRKGGDGAPAAVQPSKRGKRAAGAAAAATALLPSKAGGKSTAHSVGASIQIAVQQAAAQTAPGVSALSKPVAVSALPDDAVDPFEFISDV